MRVSIEIYELESGRLARVANALAYVLRRAGPIDTTPIMSLHDHKGELRVVYTSTPSDALKKLIEHAWEGEREYNVAHEVQRWR